MVLTIKAFTKGKTFFQSLEKLREAQNKPQNMTDSNSYQIKQRHFPLKLKSTATFFWKLSLSLFELTLKKIKYKCVEFYMFILT